MTQNETGHYFRLDESRELDRLTFDSEEEVASLSILSSQSHHKKIISSRHETTISYYSSSREASYKKNLSKLTVIVYVTTEQS
jgi:hypothetical protein